MLLALGAGLLVGAEGRAVPKLVGERTEIASQLAVLADLKTQSGIYYIAPQNWRNDIKPAVVYLQTPQPGTQVPAGSTVGVWTFVRAAEDGRILDVPDLRGKPVEEATRALTDLELKPFGLPESTMGLQVVDQYPTPGAKVYAGTSVLLTSQAPKP